MTRFLVNCPHAGCSWRGRLKATPSLVPQFGFATNVSIVNFECPRCQQDWQARVIGDDVESLPLFHLNEDEDASWPLVDIGAGG